MWRPSSCPLRGRKRTGVKSLKDGEDYNFGLVDIEDRPYEELATAFTKLHSELPALHSTAGNSADAAVDKPMSIPIVLHSQPPFKQF